MRVSAAYGPKFLWLQHPSAQQYSGTHGSSNSSCRTTHGESNQGRGAKDLRLPGWHMVPREVQPAQVPFQFLAGEAAGEAAPAAAFPQTL